MPCGPSLATVTLSQSTRHGLAHLVSDVPSQVCLVGSNDVHVQWVYSACMSHDWCMYAAGMCAVYVACLACKLLVYCLYIVYAACMLHLCSYALHVCCVHDALGAQVRLMAMLAIRHRAGPSLSANSRMLCS